MIVLIFGSIGEGKTSEMIRVLKQSYKPCVVIDTIKDNEEYYDKGTKQMNYRSTFNQYAFRISTIQGLNDFTRHKYVYTPMTPEDFQEVCLKIQEYKNLNIFIDELDMWISSKFLPVETYNLFRFSRHMRYNIFCTMRNPYEIHRNIRACATDFWIFKLIEKGHLDYFDHFQENISDKIKALPKHHYLSLKVR